MSNIAYFPTKRRIFLQTRLGIFWAGLVNFNSLFDFICLKANAEPFWFDKRISVTQREMRTHFWGFFEVWQAGIKLLFIPSTEK